MITPGELGGDLSLRYHPEKMQDKSEHQVTGEELDRDPTNVVRKAATDGPVVVVDEHGQPQLRIFVPRDERPVHFG